MRKTLVMEGDENVRTVLLTLLGKEGIEAVLADGGEASLDILRTDRLDLILTDLLMPGINGIGVLKKMLASSNSVPIIVLNASGTVTAVEAMRHGAFACLARPLDLDELAIVLEKALFVSKLQKENARLTVQLKKAYDVTGHLNDVPGMRSVPMETIAEASARRSSGGIAGNGINLKETINAMERNLVLQALERTGGVRSKAAQLLGLNRTTLIEKIKKMGIATRKK